MNTSPTTITPEELEKAAAMAALAGTPSIKTLWHDKDDAVVPVDHDPARNQLAFELAARLNRNDDDDAGTVRVYAHDAHPVVEVAVSAAGHPNVEGGTLYNWAELGFEDVPVDVLVDFLSGEIERLLAEDAAEHDAEAVSDLTRRAATLPSGWDNVAWALSGGDHFLKATAPGSDALDLLTGDPDLTGWEHVTDIDRADDEHDPWVAEVYVSGPDGLVHYRPGAWLLTGEYVERGRWYRVAGLGAWLEEVNDD